VGIAFFYQGVFVNGCFAFFVGAISSVFYYVAVIKENIRYGIEGA